MSRARDFPRRVQIARASFWDQGHVPANLVDEAIARSWRRCAEIGLPAKRSPDLEHLAERALAERRERNRLLLTQALPEIESLYEQIANTHSTVLLADDQGLILHSLGDTDFIAKAKRVALEPGAFWNEENQGTNAIGTALVERAPVTVHGSEHYCESNQFLACSAVPILEPCGNALGILDVSGDYRSRQMHTIALVRMSARLIENRLLATRYSDEVVLHFHARPELVGTLGEGIAVFSAAGELLAANRNGQVQLGVDLYAGGRHHFAGLFALPFGVMLGQARRNIQDTLPLVLQNGVRLHARVCVGAALGPGGLAVPGSDIGRKGVVSKRDHKSQITLDVLDLGDACMGTAIAKARKALGKDLPVLIEGETGVGKELFATAIHNSGLRCDKPLVTVNCAAIPENLIEAELFGYEEGAFTGARRKGAIGKIRQAHGGTLFLDEIGDMPLPLQAHLLRVLQEREVTPLGSAKSYPVDILVISATNRRLREEVAAGTFRSDLYYRLNGLLIRLPALRERTDMEQLVRCILLSESENRPPEIAPDVLGIFRRHPWPGNVRQLHNVLHMALVMRDLEPFIRREHLPEDFLDEWEEAEAGEPAFLAPAPEKPARRSLKAIEAAAIKNAIEANDGNISAAARQLGIGRNTLYRRLRDLTPPVQSADVIIPLSERAARSDA